MMKTLLLAGASIVLMTLPAQACRGTAEYPQVAHQLAKAALPASEKEAYAKRLEAGAEKHRRGHELNDQDLRLESLKILDEIKAKITL